MIRKLSQKDQTEVLEYLYKESAFNIFIIGDIEAFGFDKEWQTLYGEFDSSNEYISVLLFYRENCVYYSHKDVFNVDYLPIMKERPFEFMSGKESLMKLLKPHFPDFKLKPMYFCKATSLENQESFDYSNVKVVTTQEECVKLYDLLSTIREFGIYKKPREDFIKSKLNSIKMGVTYYIEEDNKMVSTVATTAETTVNAMVVAVATHQDYRQRGFASILMTYLMKEYFENRQKELCLFYDNPKAGKIYLRLGFKDFGKWAMMNKE